MANALWGRAAAILGALVAGDSSLVENSPASTGARRSRRRNEVPTIYPAKVLRAMRSRYRPHDGAKQQEKDRRRDLVNQVVFLVPSSVSRTMQAPRAGSIVVRATWL